MQPVIHVTAILRSCAAGPRLSSLPRQVGAAGVSFREAGFQPGGAETPLAAVVARLSVGATRMEKLGAVASLNQVSRIKETAPRY